MPLDIDKRITVVCMWKAHADHHGLPPLTEHPDCGCGVYAVPQGFDLSKLKGQIGASFTIDMQNDMAKHLVIAMLQELEYTFATLAVNGKLGNGKVMPIKSDEIKDTNPDAPPTEKGRLPNLEEIEESIKKFEALFNKKEGK